MTKRSLADGQIAVGFVLVCVGRATSTGPRTSGLSPGCSKWRALYDGSAAWQPGRRLRLVCYRASWRRQLNLRWRNRLAETVAGYVVSGIVDEIAAVVAAAAAVVDVVVVRSNKGKAVVVVVVVVVVVGFSKKNKYYAQAS
jgi:hypothetical protein